MLVKTVNARTTLLYAYHGAGTRVRQWGKAWDEWSLTHWHRWFSFISNRLRHEQVLLKLHFLHEGMTLVHNLLTLSAQSVGPGHLNCGICGVCGELHVQSSHTKPKPNELVGEVCLCDQNHWKDDFGKPRIYTDDSTCAAISYTPNMTTPVTYHPYHISHLKL